MVKTKNLLIVSFLVSFITILLFLPALQNDFVNWDDNEYVYENTHIRSLDLKSIQWMFTSFHAANWHPLTWLSHTADYAMWGLNPLGHHLTSILFHGLNTFLVVVLITRLIRLRHNTSFKQEHALIAAAVTGLLFGIHPVHVESVAWVSERKDVLYAFFYLLSILSYLRYRSSQKRRALSYSVCLFFFILSLMSKPMAVTLPFVLILLDWYPLGRIDFTSLFPSGRRVLREKLPFFSLSIASSVLTLMAQRKGEAFTSVNLLHLDERILIAVRALIFYLYKMVLPLNLASFYPYSSKISFIEFEYVVPFAIVSIISILSIYFFRKQKILSVAWIYYIVTMLPVLGIIQVGDQAAADRYTYLPSLGPFLLAGLGAAYVWRKTIEKNRLLIKMLLISLSLVVLINLITDSSKQIKTWKNSRTLWNRELEIYPNVALAYIKLGITYYYEGHFKIAIEHYQKALDINPRYLEAHNNIGLAYFNSGFIDRAIEHYRIALRLKPDYLEAHYNLGLAYRSQGNKKKAEEHFTKARELNPALFQ
jgi:tetratricopeptide (TPR) repeat protein